MTIEIPEVKGGKIFRPYRVEDWARAIRQVAGKHNQPLRVSQDLRGRCIGESRVTFVCYRARYRRP